MNITIERDRLLQPLSYISGIVEKRQTLPILANVHIQGEGGNLTLTGTDLEVEVRTRIDKVQCDAGEFTVRARKLFDICRALPEGGTIKMEVNASKAVIRSGRSRFSLQTLPADDFPKLETEKWDLQLAVGQGALKVLFDRTSLAMAQQDVRYYLNGLLLEAEGQTLRAVATDGHRLAKSEISIDSQVADRRQAIVPRKAILELARFLEDNEDPVTLQINPNHIRAQFKEIMFTSKLIDGRFPEYEKVIPTSLSTHLLVERNEFYEVLARASILTNEKFRGVRVGLESGRMQITANNPEQEEAVDELTIEFDGEPVEIGFNVGYLMEALRALSSDKVDVGLQDPSSSCTLQDPDQLDTLYLIMPMRL